MSAYFTASAYFHPTDGSQSARAPKSSNHDKEKVRNLLARLRGTQPAGDIAMPLWSRQAVGNSPDWAPGLVPLLSARMVDIVRAQVTRPEDIEWLPAVVVSGDGLREAFYVPHFLERPDVLSREASTWGVNGEPIRWVLSRAKIAGRDFIPSHAYGRNVIISEELRDAFLEAGLVGVDIEPARVSD